MDGIGPRASTLADKAALTVATFPCGANLAFQVASYAHREVRAGLTAMLPFTGVTPGGARLQSLMVASQLIRYNRT